jgi:cholesterol transport system auxiliary component
MNKQVTSRLIVLPFVLCLGLAGCLSRPALVRRNYALQTPAIVQPTSQGRGVVAIRPCKVSPLFAGRSFVYRTGPDAYETDPYAGFLVSPAEALAIPIRAYLRNSGVFQDVAEPGTEIKADRVLEIHVSELYGDFRTPNQPAAVLSLRIILFDASGEGAGKVLFQKDYSRRAPIERNTAAAVVAGWDQALAEIMKEAAADLAAVR